MRFLADGPSIPDELLLARDQGRVIFFVGAGVSRARAKLVDFLELAQQVAKSLGADSDSPAGQLLTSKFAGHASEIESSISIDRVFTLLERDFFPRDIERAVARALRPKKGVDLSAHRIVIDLSRDPNGKPRLVTTNFDLLFEQSDRSLPQWRRPTLPDPSASNQLTGVIHLHGCTTSDYSGADGDGFVLSSAQFGRAYLSDGWATRFIQTALENFYVVFLGYSAEDPPVQYLLEALNSAFSARHNIYTFQSGNETEAHARWYQRGVKPIVYGDHNILWKTLEAWSERARFPDAWVDNIVSMATTEPGKLSPHERGQVAHIVSYLEGARKFAETKDVPVADWLCVFDPHVRFSKTGRVGGYESSLPIADPFDFFGLDFDEPPPKTDSDDHYAKRDVPSRAWDAFAVTNSDRRALTDAGVPSLRGYFARNVPPIPPRQWSLGRWIARVTSQPAAAWWASGQVGLHPDIQRLIRQELNSAATTASLELRRIWRLLSEAWDRRTDDFDPKWLEIIEAIKKDGWTERGVRDIAAWLRPYLRAARPFWTGPLPPGRGAKISHIAEFSVEYPKPYSPINIPNKLLKCAAREWAKNLEYAIFLHDELQRGFELGGNLCPIEPDPKLEGESSDRSYGVSPSFLFYVDILKRLIKKDQQAARNELLAWPKGKEPIFERLHIWAHGQRKLTSAKEAYHFFIELRSDTFWDSRHRRDLLLVLKARWREFSTNQKKSIARKILRGRSRYPSEDLQKYRKYRAWDTLDILYWLKLKKCDLPFDLKGKTKSLRKSVPEWTRKEAARADQSLESSGGFVQTNTDYDSLSSLPLNRVLEEAQRLKASQGNRLAAYDPFSGLAAKRPVRALGSIIAARKLGHETSWAWETFLKSDGRKSDQPRFVNLITGRLLQLLEVQLKQLVPSIADWLQRAESTILASPPDNFERLWKAVLPLLDEHTAASAILRTASQNVDWTMEAINSPVGKLAQTLMKLSPPKPKQGQLLPESWRFKIEELLGLKGDQRRHALVIMGYALNWFFYVDPKWTTANLVPLFEVVSNDADAAWSGFLWHAQVPRIGLYQFLKPGLLRNSNNPRHEKYRQVVVAMLLAGWSSRSGRRRLISDQEMRNLLVNIGDQGRTTALWHIENWSKKGAWAKLLPVFLRRVWPLHRAARSPQTSSRLVSLAVSDPNIFKKIVNIIIPLIDPTDDQHLFIFNLNKAENTIVEGYPRQLLKLLVAALPDVASKWPYATNQILEKLVRAKPALRTDPQYMRLQRIWDAR